MTVEVARPWAPEGECADMDPFLFFSEGDTPAEAVDACARCTVRGDCLDWALRHERYGYWGGTAARARARMRRTLHITLVDPTPDPTPTPSDQDDAA